MQRIAILLFVPLLVLACEKKEPDFGDEASADTAVGMDATPPGPDSTAAPPPRDAAMVLPDRGAPPPDRGFVELDSRPPILDAAPLEPDFALDILDAAAMAVPDTQTFEPFPGQDAANGPMDAASAEADAAPPAPDAEAPELDAAPPVPDAAPPAPDAAPPEPDAAPAPHPVLDGPAPAFEVLEDDEIDALCRDRAAQVTNFQWIAEQIGTDVFTLEEGYCAYLVARAAIDALDPQEDCELRLPACVETMRDIFEADDFVYAECRASMRAGRTAGCRSSADRYLQCLVDSYPLRISFGFTPNELARLSLLRCADLVEDLDNFHPRRERPDSCRVLRNLCLPAAPMP